MTSPERKAHGRTIWLHVIGVIAIPACLAAGVFEWRRATSGNELSWGYAVEWPLIAGYGSYLWLRLVRDRRELDQPQRSAGPAGCAGPDAAAALQAAEPDPGLEAWQRYLADLNAREPPGGPGSPPSRRSR